MIKHSSLIAFDIDFDTKNQAITNWNKLKNQLSHIRNIAYCGQSVGGNGYWGLIPIAYPEKHKEHFEALVLYFARLGIHLDPAPKNVASLRGYSWDSKPYFNHKAIPFTHVIQHAKPAPVLAHYSNLSNSAALTWAINELQNASAGERHLMRLKVSGFIGKLVAKGQIRYEDAERTLIDTYLSQYDMIDSASVQKKEINAIYDGLKNGMQSDLTM